MDKFSNSLKTSTFFDKVYYPEKTEELIKIARKLKQDSKKFIVVGNTTNTLFRNEQSSMTIISLSKLSKNCTIENEFASVSSNYSTIQLVLKLQKKGYNNLNFLIGVPGTIGGNVIMNAGCYGYEISDYLTSITIIDENQEICVLSRDEMIFGYRFSSLMNKDIIILEVKIRISPTMVHDISFLNKKRMITQPIGSRTLGSIFKNPYKHKAWVLLDGVGLRGFKIGNTQISQKHPNFIISEDGATPEEYDKLIELARKMVYLKYKIRLRREVMIYD